MSPATRTILVLTLMLAPAAGVFAQETPTPTDTAPGAEAAAAAERAGQSSERVREEFRSLLARHPPQLSTVLALEPALLSNEAFLARYPEVQGLLAEHPEIRRNPHYYLRGYEIRRDRERGSFDETVETLSIVFGLALGAFALAWFVRTVIEQRRWNRLSRTQAEVHNKILDRFGSSEELLDYIRTPAGTKFLESAPIPLHAKRPMQDAPASRTLLSIQLGVVIATAGLGILLVSLRFAGEAAQGFFAMGAIAFFIGAGFVASSVVSILLSRRLGLWAQPDLSAENRLDDAGPVR